MLSETWLVLAASGYRVLKEGLFDFLLTLESFIVGSVLSLFLFTSSSHPQSNLVGIRVSVACLVSVITTHYNSQTAPIYVDDRSAR